MHRWGPRTEYHDERCTKKGEHQFHKGQKMCACQEERGSVEFTTNRVSHVPVLYQGPFDLQKIDYCVEDLRADGSHAAPGFYKAEGIVVFHTASSQAFKLTLDGDGHKG